MNPHTPIKTADDSRATLNQLVGAVNELSEAADMGEVRSVVSAAARNLTGADGAAFMVRDGKQCFYAEEDAIEPLWKGRYFPIDECISGWVMVYRQAVAVSDIDLDERLRPETYGATFVKSMAMVPIRSSSPVGAIGTYWDRIHTPSKAEISALQSLADATAVTLENVSLNSFALNDSLSGLYNRRGFFSRGSERISSNRDLGVGDQRRLRRPQRDPADQRRVRLRGRRRGDPPGRRRAAEHLRPRRGDRPDRR